MAYRTACNWKHGKIQWASWKSSTGSFWMLRWFPYWNTKPKAWYHIIHKPTQVSKYKSIGNLWCRQKKMYIFVGWPDSAHDSRVWSMDPFSLAQRSRERPRSSDHASRLISSQFICNDSAYELRTFNMTPYKTSAALCRPEKVYKKKHSRVRVLIEQAFGRLKGIFRRTKLIDWIRTLWS